MKETQAVEAGDKSGTSRKARLFALEEPPCLQSFAELCSRRIEPLTCPLVSNVQSNIPIYNLSEFTSASRAQLASLQDEWYHILAEGPGVFVTKGLFTDTALLERVNKVYAGIIAEEKGAKSGAGDHFAASGKNDRIWNSFSKHCLADSPSFVEYYSNPFLGLIFEAWLGPAYRVTAQVNVVKPGGQAQMPHRDYHLGFQTANACAAFPRGMQHASQFLTLQGAVAHTDMPRESGPTRLLPFSQMFEGGYMAYRRPEFVRYFLEHYVALPLEQGDGLFFNPALFHAAGENSTQDFHRSANLLQISSAFGKPMETIDTMPLINASWDELEKLYKQEGRSVKLENAVAAIAEGYPFPTNLDKMPPRMDGMAPESEQEVLMNALQSGKQKAEVMELFQHRYRSMAA